MSEEIKPEPSKVMEDKKQRKCQWERCDRIVGATVNLPAMQIEDGQLKPLPGITIPMPFCRYHQLIASSGVCGAIRDQKDPVKWNLYAPTDIVNVAETTMAAMVFSGQLENMQAMKKKAEDMIKKGAQEDKTNGTKTTSSTDKAEQPADTDRNK